MTDEPIAEAPSTAIVQAPRPTHVATYTRRASPDAPPTTVVRKLTPTRRVRAAIADMVWNGAKRAEAAKAANLTDHSLRAAFRKTHVKSAYLGELAVLRDSERARNLHALVRVRDGNTNQMAVVNAAKTLEELSGGGPSINVAVGVNVQAGWILDLREPEER